MFTSHTAKLTGSALSLYTLVSGLDRNRISPFVLLAESGPLCRWLDAARIPWDVVPYAGWTKILAAPRVRSQIRAHQIDVVHANCAVGFSRAVAKAAAQARAPLLWHVREPPDSSRVRRNTPAMLRHARCIVVVSEDLERVLAGRGTPVERVDNGVDLARFHPGVSGAAFRAERGLPDDAFVFGIIGTLEPRKNTQMFLDAAEQLVGRWPAARFLVVGTGEPAYVSGIQARIAASAALKERVILTGSIERVPEAMAACDCIVMPSAWEGFPRVLVESMCIGRPAIASAVGAVRRMVDDGRTGIVVPPGSLAALIDAMHTALADPARLRRIGAAAAEDARARFSQAAHVERMTGLIERAAEARNPAPTG